LRFGANPLTQYLIEHLVAKLGEKRLGISVVLGAEMELAPIGVLLGSEFKRQAFGEPVRSALNRVNRMAFLQESLKSDFNPRQLAPQLSSPPGSRLV
jgi:hypothetical protein